MPDATSGPASAATITSPSTLHPLEQYALEWEESIDFQTLKTILTEQNSASDSGGTASTAPAAGPRLVGPETVSQILKCPLEDWKAYLSGILATMKKYDIADNAVLIGLLAPSGSKSADSNLQGAWGGHSAARSGDWRRVRKLVSGG